MWRGMEAASCCDVRTQRRQLLRGDCFHAGADLQFERRGNDARAEQQPGPVHFLEGFEVEQVDARARLEQFELVGQALRRRRGAQLLPESTRPAAPDAIVRHGEIAQGVGVFAP